MPSRMARARAYGLRFDVGNEDQGHRGGSELGKRNRRYGQALSPKAVVSSEEAHPAIRRIAWYADDALVDVEISLLEVQQTRIAILGSLTAQTAAYNAVQREQAGNLAAVSRATGIAESANGDYELSIVRINRAGREQAAAAQG